MFTVDLSHLSHPIVLTQGHEFVMAPVARDLRAGHVRMILSNASMGDLTDVNTTGSSEANDFWAMILNTFAIANEFGASLSVGLISEPASWLLAVIGAIAAVTYTRIH